MTDKTRAIIKDPRFLVFSLKKVFNDANRYSVDIIKPMFSSVGGGEADFTTQVASMINLSPLAHFDFDVHQI